MNEPMIYHLIFSVAASTLLYLYLHHKTRISLNYIFKDNLVVIVLSYILLVGIRKIFPETLGCIYYFLNLILIGGIAFTITMIRFWRTPKRSVKAKENELVSPADGNVIYITRIEAGEIPISIKGTHYSRLEELTKTDLLDKPCWLIGINMTPFDVHKNCSPMDGEIIFNQHFKGKFLSLKNQIALTENERNTYVIQGRGVKVGVVQIASRLVKRIDSYVKIGDQVSRGDWIGMIRFGSQVDVIIPDHAEIFIKFKQQVYAGSTIIAKFSANN